MSRDRGRSQSSGRVGEYLQREETRARCEAQLASGAKWDHATWDVSQWAAENVVSNVFTGGRFSGTAEFGRFARSLQAEISPDGDASGFVLKGLELVASCAKDVSARGTSADTGGGIGSTNAMIADEGDSMVHE